MPHLTLRTLPALLGTLPLVFMLAPARAQDPPMAVQATVAVVKPAKLDLPERDQDLIRRLTVPDGYKVEVYARDLGAPRMLAVSPAGTLYATRRDTGDVVMLPAADGGGARTPRTVASRAGLHGIAFDGDRVFLATTTDVYVAEVLADGGFTRLERIIDDLPDGGQHPNRTLAIGPDGQLYISVGSSCNACAEPNPEHATILRASPDGQSRRIFASGLRNTIGFDWQPETGALYGFDHGIDWLGDHGQLEELNRIEQGGRYGWPHLVDFSRPHVRSAPPDGVSLADWKAMSTEPALGYTAHAAPMQMAFHDGTGMPADVAGDAFVALRGSWNRATPSGYEVVRVRFEDGRPVEARPFLTGFLAAPRGDDRVPGMLGRPAGGSCRWLTHPARSGRTERREGRSGGPEAGAPRLFFESVGFGAIAAAMDGGGKDLHGLPKILAGGPGLAGRSGNAGPCLVAADRAPYRSGRPISFRTTTGPVRVDDAQLAEDAAGRPFAFDPDPFQIRPDAFRILTDPDI